MWPNLLLKYFLKTTYLFHIKRKKNIVPFPVHLLSGLGLGKELRDVLWRPELGWCSGLGPALPLLVVAAAAVPLQLALQLVRVRLVSEQKWVTEGEWLIEARKRNMRQLFICLRPHCPPWFLSWRKAIHIVYTVGSSDSSHIRYRVFKQCRTNSSPPPTPNTCIKILIHMVERWNVP